MLYEEGVKYCLNKPGAKQEYIFGNKMIAFTVNGKQFCRVYEIDGQKGFVLKSFTEVNLVLRQMYSGIHLPHNLDNEKWNVVLLESDVPDEEIRFLIDQSYKIMINALSRKDRAKILASEEGTYEES